MARYNIENDKFFLSLVNNNILRISKLGIVKNQVTGRIIGATGSGGYPKISIKDHNNNRIRSMQIHRLVWIVFKGLIKGDLIINHLDGNKLNTRLSNLEL